MFILLAILLSFTTTHLAIADQSQGELEAKPMTQPSQTIAETEGDTDLDVISATSVSNSPKPRKKIVHAKCG